MTVKQQGLGAKQSRYAPDTEKIGLDQSRQTDRDGSDWLRKTLRNCSNFAGRGDREAVGEGGRQK